MKAKAKDVIGMWVVCEDLDVGKVKDIVIDLESGQVSHIEVELSKAGAEVIVGAKKRWIVNTLATSALKTGDDALENGVVNVKVSKSQLRNYLRPVQK